MYLPLSIHPSVRPLSRRAEVEEGDPRLASREAPHSREELADLRSDPEVDDGVDDDDVAPFLSFWFVRCERGLFVE
jgi:hypothetical protein